MGLQITAKCNCGYQAKVLVGGGMFNFTTTCQFPCYCSKCRNLVNANLLADKPICPKCKSPEPIPYDDPRLVGSLGKHQVAEWDMEEEFGRELILTDGSYKCPKCEKMTMTFTDDMAVFFD